MPRITKSYVESLKPRPNRYEEWDDLLEGFYVRVYPTGAKTFGIRAKMRDGSRPRYSIGKFRVLTVEQARERARELLADIAAGKNPVKAEREAKAAATLGEMAPDYLEQYAKNHKKASSVRSDRNILKNQILPHLGRMKVRGIEVEHVQRFKAKFSKTPTRANRALALLSHMLTWAEGQGLRPVNSNPCFGVKRYPDQKRNRFLTPAENQVLSSTLRKFERSAKTRDAAEAIRLLMLTGCRRSEIVELEWDEHVFLDEADPHLRPDGKTGLRYVPLIPDAVAVLQRRQKAKVADAKYVFPGRNGGIRSDVDRVWRDIRSAAGIPDVVLHVLRHSFASTALHSGVTLFEIGRLLGHRTVLTTQRYAHLADSIARDAATKAGKQLTAQMKTGKPLLQSVK